MKTVSGGNDKLPEKGIGKTPDTALLHAYNATFVEKLRPTMIDIFTFERLSLRQRSDFDFRS